MTSAGRQRPPADPSTGRRSPTRRALLGGGAALAGALVLGGPRSLRPVAGAAPRHLRQDSPLGTLFTLGVASGDPRAGSVVIWTRLAPDPLAPDGGMTVPSAEVEWQVATDEGFADVVASGTATTSADRGWSVHRQVRGLRPGAEHWYRFRVGDDVSRVGRTRTAPEVGATVDELRFAVVSCNDYQHGYWGAFAGLAEEDLDVWFHVGDYIYEYPADPDAARRHDGDGTSVLRTLEEYRRRYALYKLDPALQAAHAAAPMVWVPDDHEVENDYAGERPAASSATSPEDLVAKRAVAFRAAMEHQPVAFPAWRVGPTTRLWRGFRFGRLAEVAALDTRQHRVPPSCNTYIGPIDCGAEEGADMLGTDQEAWLAQRLGASDATWNLLAQQVMMTHVPIPGLALGERGTVVNLDAWDGYQLSRRRVLELAERSGATNLVVATGDIHSTWIADLCTDFDRPDETIVGTELVTTSISSRFPASLVGPLSLAPIVTPHVHYVNAGSPVRVTSADEHHGYLRCSLTRDRLRCDVREVANLDGPEAPMSTAASFVVEDGRPGAQRD